MGCEPSGDERLLLASMLREELERGWIPKRADLEAVLAMIRSGGAHSSRPSW